jgi:hypothetical protein
LAQVTDLQERLEGSSFATASVQTLIDARRSLHLLVREIASSPSLIEIAAGGSYEHPNGFQKLLLFSCEDGVKLLLHTWSSDSMGHATAADHAHNHRWPFATLVLKGAYRFECFSAASGRNGSHYRYRYLAPETGGAFRLVAAGRAMLEPTLSFDLQPGATCWSDSKTIHRVVPLDLPLQTLFLQGPRDQLETTVVSPEPARKTGEVGIRRFNQSEWQERAFRAIDCSET